MYCGINCKISCQFNVYFFRYRWFYLQNPIISRCYDFLVQFLFRTCWFTRIFVTFVEGASPKLAKFIDITRLTTDFINPALAFIFQCACCLKFSFTHLVGGRWIFMIQKGGKEKIITLCAPRVYHLCDTKVWSVIFLYSKPIKAASLYGGFQSIINDFYTWIPWIIEYT